MYTNGSGELEHPITADMFDSSDIDCIVPSFDDSFTITFNGMNGIIPCSFFDSESKEKIMKTYRKKNSELWRLLNEPSC